MRLLLTIAVVALLAGCGGHELATCSGPTFSLTGPAVIPTRTPLAQVVAR